MQLDVIIMKDESGGYVAFVPALPGCHTQGDTLEEVRKNIKEAIKLYIETLTEEEKKELLSQPNFIAMERMKIKA